MMDERWLKDVQMDGEQKEVQSAVSHTGRGSANSIPTGHRLCLGVKSPLRLDSLPEGGQTSNDIFPCRVHCNILQTYP